MQLAQMTVLYANPNYSRISVIREPEPCARPIYNSGRDLYIHHTCPRPHPMYGSSLRSAWLLTENAEQRGVFLVSFHHEVGVVDVLLEICAGRFIREDDQPDATFFVLFPEGQTGAGKGDGG